MKIIQSFAEFEEGNFYYGKLDNKKYLNFYTFFLSYLTLQKYYRHVTMYCNKMAYDSFIKYIPYNEIKIVENNNSFTFWSYYKVDIMRLMTEDFIHVDSDVFIFDDLFSKFINDKKYDAIIQDNLKKEHNMTATFVDDNKEFIIKNNIINPKIYDGTCAACGTIGMRIKIKDDYIKICDRIKSGYINNELVNANAVGMILEELSFKLIILRENLNVYEVLPRDLVELHGNRKVGDIVKYTHMWFGTKFNMVYIDAIKKKIKEEFPKEYSYVETYENKVMKNIKLSA